MAMLTPTLPAERFTKVSFLLRLIATTVVTAGGMTCPITQAEAAQEAPAKAASPFTIASGSLALEAPKAWQRVEPKAGMIETEFSIPSEAPAATDPQDAVAPPGRMTVMGAGGSVQANIDRWYGQFSQPDGSATKDKAVTKTLKLAGCTVTMVDVSGTFKDSPAGPFGGGKAVDRLDYRMLAAIVETPKNGSYFLKFYGPGKTVAKQADGFRAMIEGMVATGK